MPLMYTYKESFKNIEFICVFLNLKYQLFSLHFRQYTDTAKSNSHHYTMHILVRDYYQLISDGKAAQGSWKIFSRIK